MPSSTRRTPLGFVQRLTLTTTNTTSIGALTTQSAFVLAITQRTARWFVTRHVSLILLLMMGSNIASQPVLASL
jgi:hypothetical protein